MKCYLTDHELGWEVLGQFLPWLSIAQLEHRLSRNNFVHFLAQNRIPFPFQMEGKISNHWRKNASAKNGVFPADGLVYRSLNTLSCGQSGVSYWQILFGITTLRVLTIIFIMTILKISMNAM